MSFSSEVIALAPDAYYRLDEASGTTAADSSGHGRTGLTHSTNVVVGVGSLLADGDGKAARYNRTDTHSSLAYESWMAVGGGGFTVLARVKPDSTTLSSGGFIAGRWTGGGSDDYVWNLGINGLSRLTGIIHTDAAEYDVMSAASLSSSIAKTVALRWNSSTSKLSAWVDGVKSAEVTTSGTISPTTGALELGRVVLLDEAGVSYGGDIDEFAYWASTALSDAALLSLHTAAITAPPAANPTDPVGVTDSVTPVRAVDRAVSDTAGVTDLVSDGATAGYDLTPADAVGISDTATPVLVPGAGVNDTVGVTDSVSTATHSLGSVWLPYPVTSAGSQVLDFSIVPTSPEEPWPFVYEGDGYSNSLWLSFTASDTQTLSLALATTFASGIEVWTGDVVADPENDLSIEGYGQGTLEVAIAAGQTIRMRAHPLLVTQTTGTGTLTWSVAARPETGVLGFVCAAEVLETPGWLAVSLLSASPSAAVTFALDGGSTFFTVTSEEDGTFEGAVELPALTVGSHTITATDVDGQVQTQTFTVLLVVPPDDTIPGSTDPATAPSLDPVIHWVLEDPMPGGIGTYTFPINPSEMSSPFPEKQLRPERTVHPSGQDVVWEGRPDPVEWSVKGTVVTEAFYDALASYHALQRRLYVVDHHQRAWVVAFDSLTFEKKGRPDDWMHTYSAKFLILGGPVSLS